MKAKNINTLADTYWDANPHLRKFLVSLKADYLSGALVLCSAFFIQFIANVPGTVPAEPVFISSAAGALLAAAVGAAVGGLFYGYRLWVIRSIERQFALDEEQQ
ncbi:hypothetical protein [Parachitinimonas caeni]|uniref:DUF485 domain-containing protein n=1 Tax=Parachitinimonas caeni TaxID=3031301 RepID=A0ABT7E2F1_9NEIS|nr:hypothetical protein [Parachitinimonas caeni]MDK2126219.1 hypothetical protein [Parachitinimonas caeni]